VDAAEATRGDRPATAQEAGDGNFSVGPVTVGVDGVSVGNTTLISREVLNERLRPLNVLRRGLEEFVFPLATPAPITSLFGWRTHPIFGDQRLHTGTDLGAPTGTPVVAAKGGTVITADYLGGYGLTVILRHEGDTQETRYAHLSQLMVRPGEQVKQGDVVGLVGSTGNSTGPHLHFELRELTAQGWVLVDPDDMLNYAVANLMNNLNQPLNILSLLTGTEAEADGTTGDEMAIPFRPAQPNAS
jgi:murein DD-endopeptidase MepM/ murein hydrolase activator NlpD